MNNLENNVEDNLLLDNLENIVEVKENNIPVVSNTPVSNNSSENLSHFDDFIENKSINNSATTAAQDIDIDLETCDFDYLISNISKTSISHYFFLIHNFLKSKKDECEFRGADKYVQEFLVRIVRNVDVLQSEKFNKGSKRSAQLIKNLLRHFKNYKIYTLACIFKTEEDLIRGRLIRSTKFLVYKKIYCTSGYESQLKMIPDLHSVLATSSAPPMSRSTSVDSLDSQRSNLDTTQPSANLDTTSPPPNNFIPHCLHLILNFVKDINQQSLEFSGLNKDDANILHSVFSSVIDEHFDNGALGKESCLALWEAVKILSLRFEFRIKYIECSLDTKSLLLEKQTRAQEPKSSGSLPGEKRTRPPESDSTESLPGEKRTRPPESDSTESLPGEKRTRPPESDSTDATDDLGWLRPLKGKVKKSIAKHKELLDGLSLDLVLCNLKKMLTFLSTESEASLILSYSSREEKKFIKNIISFSKSTKIKSLFDGEPKRILEQILGELLTTNKTYRVNTCGKNIGSTAVKFMKFPLFESPPERNGRPWYPRTQTQPKKPISTTKRNAFQTVPGSSRERRFKRHDSWDQIYGSMMVGSLSLISSVSRESSVKRKSFKIDVTKSLISAQSREGSMKSRSSTRDERTREDSKESRSSVRDESQSLIVGESREGDKESRSSRRDESKSRISDEPREGDKESGSSRRDESQSRISGESRGGRVKSRSSRLDDSQSLVSDQSRGANKESRRFVQPPNKSAQHARTKFLKPWSRDDRKDKLLEALSVPVQIDKAVKIMVGMGWKGGALGPRGTGITEPIMPNIGRVFGAGFGHAHSSHSIHSAHPQLPVKTARKPTPILDSQGCFSKRKRTPSTFRQVFLNHLLELLTSTKESKVLSFFPVINKREAAFVRQAIRAFAERCRLQIEREDQPFIDSVLAEFTKHPGMVVTVFISNDRKQLTYTKILGLGPQLHSEKTRILGIASTEHFSVKEFMRHHGPLFSSEKSLQDTTYRVSCLLETLKLARNQSLNTLKVDLEKEVDMRQRNFTHSGIATLNKDKQFSPESPETALKALIKNHMVGYNFSVKFTPDNKSFTLTKEFAEKKEDKNDVNNMTINNNDEHKDNMVEIGGSVCKENDQEVNVVNNNTNNKNTTESNAMECDEKPTEALNIKSESNLKTDKCENNSLIEKQTTKDCNANEEFVKIHNIADIMDVDKESKIICLGSMNENPADDMSVSECSGFTAYLDLSEAEDSADICMPVDKQTDALNNDKPSESECDKFVDLSLNPAPSNAVLNIDLEGEQSQIENKADVKIVHLTKEGISPEDIPKHIQGLICFKILESKDLPLIECHGIQNNALIYSCHTEKSFEWLNEMCVANDIKIFTKEVDKLSLKIKSFFDFDDKYLFDLLEIYNKAISTKGWIVLKKDKMGDCVVFDVKMDKKSINYILDSKLALYAGVDKVSFSIIFN